jgi:2-dehydro-3-deoxyphosphogluconate aldolase/(4S)-4-hydroxy-2-oxoglutarate aldolase
VENWGITLVKVFPARQLGGPAFIKAIKACFLKMQLLVTGGVEPTEADLRLVRKRRNGSRIGSQLFATEMLQNADALYGHLKKITGFIEISKPFL